MRCGVSLALQLVTFLSQLLEDVFRRTSAHPFMDEHVSLPSQPAAALGGFKKPIAILFLQLDLVTGLDA
jgi:hypothetical protein